MGSSSRCESRGVVVGTILAFACLVVATSGVEPVPDGLSLPAEQELRTLVPHFFTVPTSETAKQLWLRVDEAHWVERYPDGTESKYKVVGRTQVRGHSGTLVAKVAGDPRLTGNGNDGNFQVFIPDKGQGDNIFVLFRHLGQPGAGWHNLGFMRNAE